MPKTTKPVIQNSELMDDARSISTAQAAKMVGMSTTLMQKLVDQEEIKAWKTPGAGELLHYKVQDPSLANWFGLAMALRNTGISDFPICNKSFDLSYCGNDL
jgi:hypothetical protein